MQYINCSCRYRADLLNHGLQIEDAPKLPQVDLKLPPLRGQNIEEHFYQIANEQSESYKDLVNSLVLSSIIPLPKVSCLTKMSSNLYNLCFIFVVLVNGCRLDALRSNHWTNISSIS